MYDGKHLWVIVRKDQPGIFNGFLADHLYQETVGSTYTGSLQRAVTFTEREDAEANLSGPFESVIEYDDAIPLHKDWNR